MKNFRRDGLGWARQDKLHLVKTLPTKPQPFESHVYDYSEQEDPHCFPGIPIKPNADSVYLGVGNWCWGPFHDRTECWYLHRGDTHWLLWFGLDHGDGHEWMLGASVPLRSISEEQASVYLMVDYFRREDDYDSNGPPNSVIHEGALSAGHFEAIRDLAAW